MSTQRSGNQAGKIHARAQQTAERSVNAAVHEKLAFEMRVKGCEFEEIALACGFVSNGKPNASAAYKAWKRALRHISQPTIEEMRQEILAEQRAVIRALQSRLAKGDTFAAKALNDFHERRAKLMGLDAPVESSLSGGQIMLVSIAADIEAAI